MIAIPLVTIIVLWVVLFMDREYHDNGVMIPMLHGKTIYEWTKLGCFTMADIKAYAEEEEREKRMDVIGSNGNDGDHYNDLSKV